MPSSIGGMPIAENPLQRRAFLAAMGVSGTGGSLAELDSDDGALSSDEGKGTNTPPTEALYEDWLALSGRRVVGANGYDTIMAAWDDAETGDIIYVHSSYDAETAGESFPIDLDCEAKEVLLTGGHPSGSVIDASHTTENVIEVTGAGHHDYRNMPLVQNLKLVGGNVGLTVHDAPYASFKDLVVWKADSHAYELVGGGHTGTFGVTFRNCIAWNNGGSGFRLNTDARPHGTTFLGCHALFNDEYGLMLRGTAGRFFGGSIQNNGIRGVDARTGSNQLLDGVYFEGNGTQADSPPHPLEVLLADSTISPTVQNCYFNGVYARDFQIDRQRATYGVALVGAQCPSVHNCAYWNYNKSFLYARDTEDADIHRATHASRDDTHFLSGWDNERLRSGERILPTDLTTTDGAFDGDIGFHRRADGEVTLCTWYNGRWCTHGPTQDLAEADQVV